MDTKKIKTNPVFSLCLLSLMFLLSACSDSDSDSDSDTLFKNGISYTNNYLFYSSDGAIYAINPSSPSTPIPIEEPEANATAPIIISYYSWKGDGTGSLLYPALVYAKEGKIWGVSAFANDGLKRAQLSNENQAHHVCAASGRYNFRSIPELDFEYHYELAGEDDVCYSNSWSNIPGGSDDNIQKSVTALMNASNSPYTGEMQFRPDIPGSIVTFAQYNPDDISYKIVGQLVLDEISQALIWFDEYRTPASKIVVAESVTSARLLQYSTNETVFLKIDQTLRLFDSKSKTLSTVLLNFDIDDSYPYINLDNNSFDLAHIVTKKALYTIPRDASNNPELIYQLPTEAIGYRVYGSTLNSYVLVEEYLTEKIVYAIARDGQNKIELYRPTGNSNIVVTLSNNRVFIENDLANFIKIASDDGSYSKVLENHVIIDFLTPSTTDSNYDRNSWFLTAEYIGTTELRFATRDADGNALVELGTVSNYTSESISQRLHISSDNTLITLRVNYNNEIYFTNLGEANSLIRITENAIDDTVIDTYWYEYSDDTIIINLEN